MGEETEEAERNRVIAGIVDSGLALLLPLTWLDNGHLKSLRLFWDSATAGMFTKERPQR